MKKNDLTKEFEKFEKYMEGAIKNCELSIKHENGDTKIKVVGSNHAIEFLMLELIDKLKSNMPKKYFENFKSIVIEFLNID